MFSAGIEVLSNGPDAPVELSASEEMVKNMGLVFGDGNDKAISAAQGGGVIGGSTYQTDRRPPYSLQYSLGIQRELSSSTVFEVGYVGNHGVRLVYSPDWNRVIANTGGMTLSETLGLAAPFSQGFRYYQKCGFYRVPQHTEFVEAPLLRQYPVQLELHLCVELCTLPWRYDLLRS